MFPEQNAGRYVLGILRKNGDRVLASAGSFFLRCTVVMHQKMIMEADHIEVLLAILFTNIILLHILNSESQEGEPPENSKTLSKLRETQRRPKEN